MKHLVALLCIASFMKTNAQLVNGSFESGSEEGPVGWSVPCACAPAYLVPGGAPGGGGQCVGLDNVDLDCICMVLNATQQMTPWVTPGTWILSGWIKSAVPGDIPGSFIRLSEGPAFFSPIVSDLVSNAGTWEFVSDTFVVGDFVDTDSLRISLIPDDGNQQPPAMSYFDNIQLMQDLNTAISSAVIPKVHFRPNPASDMLWVDQTEAPISITVFDAIGRNIMLRTFHHNGHTLEVDVSSVPPGPCVLVMSTRSGIRNIRFIKT